MSKKRVGWGCVRTAAPKPDLITQRMLSEFVALGEQARRHRELRQLFMDLLAAGADVEPGPLTAEVRTSRSRRLSRAKLSALIGEELVQTFLEAVEPTESRRLDVRKASARGTAPKRGLSWPAAGLSFR